MSDSTRIVTGVGIVSYPHLFKPKAFQEGSPLKYSVSILFDKKKDKAEIAAIEKAQNIALAQGKEKFSSYNPRNKKFTLALMDGDVEKPEDPIYTGKMYITPKSDNKPGIFDKYRKAIEDQSDVYAGMKARVAVNLYPFEKGGQGVACGLDSIQKIADGEPIGAGAFSNPDVFDDGLAEEFLDTDDSSVDYGDDDI